MGESVLVDLVCGPASPLPETYQRYRLVARLGSGGQADVYRAVRLCGGVTSAPVTVKVFRLDPRRPLVDELRSWDKGDAALMDLNNRGVSGICRRADGFYGPPPHPTGVAPSPHDAVPYQIYDYLHGINLKQYVTSRAGVSGIRLSGMAALMGLAETLRALHHPAEAGACPVLHMDIKPSNIMVLTDGETRLIDFTGARYYRRAEITQIAYTPESGGPEALRGEVGPSYDVHGLGAVAFYMIAGTAPRGSNAPPLARHPIFENRPALRDHLCAALADRPSDRPSTPELSQWVQRLAQIIRASAVPDLGIDWSEAKAAAVAADPSRAVGRARAVTAGTETDAFVRIEALERELVSLRAKISGNPADVQNLATLPTDPNPGGAPVPPMPRPTLPYSGIVPDSPPPYGATTPDSPPAPTSPAPASPGAAVGAAAAPLPADQNGQKGRNGRNDRDDRGDRDGQGGTPMRPGRAPVVPRTPQPDSGAYPMEPDLPRAPGGARVRGDRVRRLRRGGGWSVAGAVWALLCWVVWAAANRSKGLYVAPLVFVSTLAVAVFVFIVLRLVGRLVLETWM
ncbi:MAG TPA: hypothetical protein VKB69_13990, partial [Micromonosporaceae bacterium]|nr:hypothetical protein [Micromonosporaceae bacterium]